MKYAYLTTSFLLTIVCIDVYKRQVLMDDEQFDEINIVRGQPVSGGRLGVKIYPIMLEGQVKK